MKTYNKMKKAAQLSSKPCYWCLPKASLPFGMMLVLLMVLSLEGVSNAQIASEQVPEPLQEYFREAVQNSPRLGIYQSRVEGQQSMVRQVGSLPDPEVNLGFFLNPAEDTQFLGRFSVSAMQMFPWFGTLSAARQEQASLTEAEQEQYRAAALNLFGEVHQAWLTYAEGRAVLALVEQEKELLDNLEAQVRVRYETARASQVDLLYVELERERLLTQIENLEDALQPTQIRFNTLLNRPANADITLPETVSPRALVVDTEDIMLLSRQQSPQIRSLEAGHAAMGSGLERTRRSGYPEFGLGLEVMGRDFSTMTMMQNMNEGYIAMATVRLPLWRGKYAGQREEYEARRRGITYEIEAEQLEIDQNAEQLHSAYREAEREVALVEERIIPRLERMYRLLLETYGAAGADFNELIEIRRELLAQRIQLTQNHYRQERALIDIEQQAGIHLNLIP